jgi:hypothetical protein
MPALDVDNRQPPETETERTGEEIALVVGTSVHEGLGHRLNHGRRNRLLRLEIILTADAAHEGEAQKMLREYEKEIDRRQLESKVQTR